MSDSDTAMHSSSLKRPLSEPSSPTGSSTLDNEHDQHPRRRLRINSPVTETVVDPSLSVTHQGEYPAYTDTFGFGCHVPWADLTSEQIEVIEQHWDAEFMAQWADDLDNLHAADPARIISDLGLGKVQGMTAARWYVSSYPAATDMVRMFQEEYENLEFYYNFCTHCMSFEIFLHDHITDTFSDQLLGKQYSPLAKSRLTDVAQRGLIRLSRL